MLDSAEFVDQPPLQIYTTLLERGQYLCPVSTMYRVLAAAGQVRERRRLASHPCQGSLGNWSRCGRVRSSCYADVVNMPTSVCDPRFRAVDGEKWSA